MPSFSRYLPVLLLILSGCVSPLLIRSPGEAMIRTELYFGMSRPFDPAQGRPGGADVTEAEFEAFMEEMVAPRFPAGHTVVAAEGRWREKTGVTRHEKTRVLIILHASDLKISLKIEEIRDAYKARFMQEAVMRVDDEEKVSF